jgi:phospholipase/carboxylesterase
MTHTTYETEAEVTLEPTTPATASVIWLHGLGADGYDFVPIVNELRLPAELSIRFIFPHARPRPVTINNGFVMRAWYDIKGLTRDIEDEPGIRESQSIVQRYIEDEVSKGIATQRIVLAGFSQGGAIALQTALRHDAALAGAMALSTYLPLRTRVVDEVSAANRAIPIFMAHGTQDDIVPLSLGESSRTLLTQLGYSVEWHTYPMAHSVCLEEIADIARWLKTCLADSP